MKYVFLMLAVLGLSSSPALADAPQAAPAQVAVTHPPLATQQITVDSHTLTVEMAVTEDEQVYGLMNRTSLPANHGMLFLFQTMDDRTFWMKDTLIPLDMLFIDDHGKIITIHQNAKPQDLTSIPSNGPVLAVLELAGGSAALLHIKVGDVIHGKSFHN
jgi:uncharacterized membrane protein (UPF0127 family)